MKVMLAVCPRGSREQDYSLTMDLPVLPRAGDYISVLRQELDRRSEDLGTEDMIVRRVLWNLKTVDDGHLSYTAGEEPVGGIMDVWIECEMAIGPLSSQSHKTNAGDQARHFNDDVQQP